jgi:hypothetical protein
MELDNITQALDYLIDSEYHHYLECLEDDENAAQNHIYMVAIRAKDDLTEGVNHG